MSASLRLHLHPTLFCLLGGGHGEMEMLLLSPQTEGQNNMMHHIYFLHWPLPTFSLLQMEGPLSLPDLKTWGNVLEPSSKKTDLKRGLKT